MSLCHFDHQVHTSVGKMMTSFIKGGGVGLNVAGCFGHWLCVCVCVCGYERERKRDDQLGVRKLIYVITGHVQKLSFWKIVKTLIPHIGVYYQTIILLSFHCIYYHSIIFTVSPQYSKFVDYSFSSEKDFFFEWQ